MDMSLQYSLVNRSLAISPRPIKFHRVHQALPGFLLGATRVTRVETGIPTSTRSPTQHN